MLRLYPLLFLLACDGSASILGSQEGEPLVPPLAAEPIVDVADPDNSRCEIAASCSGPGWCADYATEEVPNDFEASCLEAEGTPSNLPCADRVDVPEAMGFCRYEGCSSLWLFDGLTEPDDFCEQLGLDFITSRG